ncbi:BON domain-containing protein [Pseudomonas sp. GD03842]|uniref:BON domain-containing protein n=1 Tax=unclassified Pseudomonas TaxID=196821 RepID=UPI000D3805B3|nr:MULTISPECIES: BON domain-containing protein [unclassified Pseudomonas]MDH0747195.1 BON domain-containing protein [Pseudomonas sp. GD03842]RAU42282.1 BON domain-containing protein [Pseudomonas sp. RIT 409]RAU55069.1 BON domain-containing protein [Pseudomonas sp. RIT 412]
MSDLSLRKNILDELEFRPDINPAHIGVTVENGIVTLSGHVTTYAQKIATERAVKTMKGVRGIAEEIEVRPEGTMRPTDDMIAARAAHIISWTTNLPEGAIKIKVQAGWVDLEGKVDWQFERDSILRAVHKIEGVVGVTNMLTLRPRLSVTDIKHRIEQALERRAEVDAQQIRVQVTGDVVTLEGQVHMLHERDVVERAVWAVPGVRKIEDHLKVA